MTGCQSRQPKNNIEISEHETDSASQASNTDVYAKPENNYDYRPLFGIYDHESTTTGFAAVLSLTQYGNDIYFTVSVSQGECKGESEGVVTILDFNEKFYTGFYDSEDCRMQFSFILEENKVDIKEVTLCSHHGNTCSFEGVYVKRAD